jgi:signal transduction histidine kinase
MIENKEEASLCAWVRLALPLIVEGEMVGLCLLGRRDPDDRYALSEIPTLQALMDQTALALLNIEQAQRLRNLYQANIGRQEAEHSWLARELHDEVLGQLALLSMSLDEVELSPQFSDAYENTVGSIRKVISGLRPGMLNYGLRPALDELVDELSSQCGGKLVFDLDVPQSEVRYPEEVEQHLYRIVQQACQNAIKHAHARSICIHGRLEPSWVVLTVQDDGIGFPAGEALDLSTLLASGHFGLAGMNERAEMIGGQLRIDSSPGHGTCVQITLEI